MYFSRQLISYWFVFNSTNCRCLDSLSFVYCCSKIDPEDCNDNINNSWKFAKKIKIEWESQSIVMIYKSSQFTVE